jgi:hypothetical protein
MFTKNKAYSLIVATTLLSMIPVGAFAQNQYGTTTANLPDQNMVRAGFNNRFDQIRAQLNNAVATGKLTKYDATNLTSKLDHMVAELNHNFATDGVITNEEVQPLQHKVETFAQEVSAFIVQHAPRSSTGGLFGAGGVPNNPAVISTINQRIAALQTRLNTATTTGQLTTFEVHTFKNSLDQTIRERDRAMRNGMNWTEARKISDDLDRLTDRITKAIANNPNLGRGSQVSNLDNKIDNLRNRINRASQRHLLTPAQLRTAQDNVGQLQRQYNRMKANGFIGFEERRRLDANLDRVTDQVNNWIADNRRSGRYRTY